MVGPDAALDAAQDAVVTALLSLDRLRRPESFGAWLVGIGLNCSRNQLRGSDPLMVLREVRGSDPLMLHEAGPRWRSWPSRGAGRDRGAAARAARGGDAARLAGLVAGRGGRASRYPAGCGEDPASQGARVVARAPRAPEGALHAVQMQVADVRRAGEGHILMLAGAARAEHWVCAPEADAIAVLLEDVEPPRPTSHHPPYRRRAPPARRSARSA